MSETTLLPVTGLQRFLFRARPDVERLAADALELAFPDENRLSARGQRGEPGAIVVLRPGADEVQILVPSGEGAARCSAIAEACGTARYTLIETTNEMSGYVLAGPFAADLLSQACSPDLSMASFPPGRVQRIGDGPARMTLWRMAETVFRFEIARDRAAAITEAIMALLDTKA